MKKLVSFLLVSAVLITAFVLPVGAVRVEELYGDVNKDGSVDTIDATIVQRHLVGVSELVSLEYALADFDNDKDVSILDASAIQMYNAKMIKHPRKYEEYLEFFVEIDDISIESVYGPEIVEDKSVRFTVLYNEEYDDTDAGKLVYNYTFSGITDESYQTTYEKDSENYVSWSFPSAGIYEIKVEVRRKLYPEVYSFTKRFEVLEGFKFDGKRFVDYNNLSNSASDYPFAPEDAVDVEYDIAFDNKWEDFCGDYGRSTVSERFVALIHTKEEYDKLFEVDNKIFTDEFFETKSLVVAVSPGYEFYDLSPIKAVSQKEGVLYVRVVYGNNSPYDGMAAPTAPTWYSFVSLDKADVENITAVQRVR